MRKKPIPFVADISPLKNWTNLENQTPIAQYLSRISVLHALRCISFISALLLIWISLRPYADLADAGQTDNLSGKNAFSYALFGLLTIITLLVLTRDHFGALRTFISLPYVLFGCWICINLVFSRDPSTSGQRLFLTACVISVAAMLLLLPASVLELNKWLSFATLTLLLFCYIGVIVAPDLSIHMATDLAEPRLAGDWRGVFGHKNTASAVITTLVFIGCYLTRSGAVIIGVLITCLSAIFLIFANGKSAGTLCLLVFLVSEIVTVSRTFLMKAIVCLIPLVALNLLTVGTVLSPELAQLSKLFPLDTTFTGRTDIWKFAFSSFSDRPLFGYGFAAFWNKELLQNLDLGEGVDDWVLSASHSHNGYLDSLLTLGVPGFLLMITILVFIPLKNFHATNVLNNENALNKLFLRIWLFGIYLSSLESFFLNGLDPMWFSFLIAIFGMHYLSRFPAVD